MAIIISQGSGATVSTDKINGEHIGFNKISTGTAGGTISWSIDSLGYGEVNVQKIADQKGYIGLVSVAQPISTTFSGNVTLDAGSKTAIIGNVTITDSKGFIGLVTIGNTPNISVVGNVTLSDSKGYIGLVTVGGIGTVTLADPKGYIGLVTTTPATAWPDPKTFIGLVTVTGSLSPAAGNVTLDAGSKTQIVGNVTISDSKGFIGLITLGGGTAWTDPKTFIGLVTVGNTVSTTFSGNVTLDAGSKTQIVGNVTISDSKGYIGLVTATLAGGNATITPFAQFLNQASLISLTSGGYGPLVSDQYGRLTLGTGVAYIGLATVDIGTNNSIAVKGNVTLTDSKGFIGLVTLGGGTAWTDPKSFIGLITVGNTVSVLHTGAGNVTLSDSKGFIGLVTLGGGTAWVDPKTFIGLVTIGGISQLTLADPKGFIGLVTIGGISQITLADPKGFIGLVTTVPTYISGYTSLSTVISALATLVIPPASNKIFLRNLYISSLGNAEVSVWAVNSSTTISRIPPSSLATQSGIDPHFGADGIQWGAQNDGLTVKSNTTVGVMLDVRFAA